MIDVIILSRCQRAHFADMRHIFTASSQLDRAKFLNEVEGESFNADEGHFEHLFKGVY